MINIRKYLIKLLGFSEKDVALIVHLLLRRTPIIVTGSNSRENDKFISALLMFVPFRKKLQYGVDCVSQEELNILYDEEKTDLNVPRYLIYVLSQFFTEKLLRFNIFKGWIISAPRGSNTVYSYILNKHPDATLINIAPYNSKVFTPLTKSDLDLTFEEKLVKKVFVDSKIITERLLRVLDKRIDKHTLFSEEITNFEEVYKYISRDVLEEEILKFVHAAKRTLILMSRIKLLRDLSNKNLKISTKTIKTAVGYDGVPLKTLLNFIKYEWESDLLDVTSSKKAQILGDWVESLWT